MQTTKIKIMHRTTLLRRSTLVALQSLALASWTRSIVAAAPPDTEEPSDRVRRLSVAEKVGERASRGLINETLETLDEAANRARLGRIVNSPEMRLAMHDLASALVTGIVDGLQSASGYNSARMSRSIATGLDRRLTPALGRLTQHVTDSALTAAMTEEQIVRMEGVAERVGGAAMRGIARGLDEELGPAVARTLERDLGPALAIVIERDLLPAIGRSLSTDDLLATVADTSRAAATGIVEGAGAAIDVKSAAYEEEGTPSSLQLFGDRVALGYGIVLFVAFAFGTMVVVLTVLLVRYSRRLREQSSVAKQREATLLALIENLEAEHSTLKPDMRDLVQSQLESPT